MGGPGKNSNISEILCLFWLPAKSIHIWVMGTLEGQLSFLKFWSQGSCLEMGLVKIWDSLTKCYTALSFILTSPKDIRTDISHTYDIDFQVMRWRSEWPVFHSSVILPNILRTMPNILRTIWWMNVMLEDNGSVWHKD